MLRLAESAQRYASNSRAVPASAWSSAALAEGEDRQEPSSSCSIAVDHTVREALVGNAHRSFSSGSGPRRNLLHSGRCGNARSWGSLSSFYRSSFRTSATRSSFVCAALTRSPDSPRLIFARISSRVSHERSILPMSCPMPILPSGGVAMPYPGHPGRRRPARRWSTTSGGRAGPPRRSPPAEWRRAGPACRTRRELRSRNSPQSGALLHTGSGADDGLGADPAEVADDCGGLDDGSGAEVAPASNT
jgi:hypothetical protein